MLTTSFIGIGIEGALGPAGPSLVAGVSLTCGQRRLRCWMFRHPRPSTPRLSDGFAPNRQSLDVESISSVRLQHPPVDHDPRRLAAFSHAKGRNHDVCRPAIFFERSGMADQRDGLAFYPADAA